MKKRTAVIITVVFFIVAYFTVAIALTVHKSNYKDSGTYTLDPITGDKLFSDPNQKPETFSDIPGAKEISILNYDVLTIAMSDTETAQVSALLKDYYQDKTTAKIYIKDNDQPLESINVLSFTVLTSPDQKEYPTKIVFEAGKSPKLYVNSVYSMSYDELQEKLSQKAK